MTRRTGGVAALALLVLVVGACWMVATRDWPGWPWARECRVSVGERTVALSTDEAERATALAASAVRRHRSVDALETDLRDTLGIDAQDAAGVAAATSGRAPHALTCRHHAEAPQEADRLDRRGLTGRAARVRADVLGAFGKEALGGYAPGGVRSGHMPGSAHYEGRAIDVFYRPVRPAMRQRGWATATYLVAHAERLRVATVIYDGRIWTAHRAAEGWRDYRVDTAGRTHKVALVLEHRDHVHVDVLD